MLRYCFELQPACDVLATRSACLRRARPPRCCAARPLAIKHNKRHTRSQKWLGYSSHDSNLLVAANDLFASMRSMKAQTLLIVFAKARKMQHPGG